MEFLIGRTLANNITNLLVEPFVREEVVEREGLDWQQLAEQEPDAGLGNGGLGRLAACFLDSLATLQIPAIGYGLRYEYGMFRQEIKDGRQVEHPDNWLRRPDPWEVVRPDEAVEVRLNCAFQLKDGRLDGRPERADDPRRHTLRPAGRRLRRPDRSTRCGSGARRRTDDFNFLEFSRGDFFDAVHEKVAAEVADARPLSRRLDAPRPEPAVRPGVFPGRLLAGRHRRRGSAAAATTGKPCPTRSPSSSTTPTRRWPSPS